MTHDISEMTDREAIDHIHKMLDVDVHNMSMLLHLVKKQGELIRQLRTDLDTQMELLVMLIAVMAGNEDSPPPTDPTLGSGGEAEAGS